jgi:catalase
MGLSDVTAAKAAIAPHDMAQSPALSILKKAKPTLEGRCLGLLLGDGADAALVAALLKSARDAGAKTKIVAETIAGVLLSDGKFQPADFRIDGGPSCLFDAVAIVASDDGAKKLAGIAAAQDFVRDAFSHLKIIAATANTSGLFAKAGLADKDKDEGCITLTKRTDADVFVSASAKGRIWAREPKVRPLPKG